MCKSGQGLKVLDPLDVVGVEIDGAQLWMKGNLSES